MFTAVKSAVFNLAIVACCATVPAISAAQDLPTRETPRPATTDGVPHM